MATPEAKTVTTTTEKRKPVFTKVDNLKPGTNGHTLTVKVVSSKPVVQKAGRSVPLSQNLRRNRIAECIAGDETGTIVFTARNEQGISILINVSICVSQLADWGTENKSSVFHDIYVYDLLI